MKWPQLDCTQAGAAQQWRAQQKATWSDVLQLATSYQNESVQMPVLVLPHSNVDSHVCVGNISKV